MSEDIELTNFVRARLEEGLSPEPPRMGEIMRAAKAASFALAARQKSRRRLRGPALAAASVALVYSFAAFFARTGSPDPKNTVADAIELLRVADGENSATAEATSMSEMLLAWQDAPYEAAVAGLADAAE